MGTQTVLARIYQSGKDAVMKVLGGAETIPQATEAEALEAFDHTCRYYLGISAQEFLRRWDAGDISKDTPNLSRVLDLLPLVR
jgi:hypothetical protein